LSASANRATIVSAVSRAAVNQRSSNVASYSVISASRRNA
jgi:hypothetical protein